MKRSFFRFLLLALLSLVLAACGVTGDTRQEDPGLDPDVVAERGEPSGLPNFGTSEGGTLSSVTTLSSTAVIYGPVDHVRQTGKPVTESASFSASPGDYTLVLTNGPDGAARSSSALIYVNGEEVIGPSEFNQQVGLITKEISLEAQNEIAVEVRGEPGATLRLQIEGEELPLKVSGNVVTAAGATVGGANVQLNFASGETFQTLTDSGGAFAFTDFSAVGAFTLEATSANNLLYGSLNGSVSSDLPQVEVSLVVAERGPGVVSGTVLSSTGEPVPGAALTIIFSETSFTASTTSNSDGSYDLSGLPADGSFSITAFDNESVTSGSVISFIVPTDPTRSVTIRLDPPPTELTTFANGDFSDGTLNGWRTEGDVKVVTRGAVFPEIAGASGLTTQASSYAAVASTAGSNRSVGRMSQPFLVDSCNTHLQGKLRFLSNEWPTYFGTQYNDAYIVKLVTPSGARVLDQGNLNSSAWSGGLAGYNGKTPVVEVDVDVSAFAGSDQPLTIDVQVSDVGDMIVDSAMAVAEFRVVDKEALNLGPRSLGTLASGDQVRLSDVTFQAPSVLSYVMPDDFVPAGVSTPYTFEEGDSLIVVTRQSDLEGGAVSFEIPVQTFDSDGNPLNLTTEKKVYFLGTDSEPTAITGGVARVPVTVPATSGVNDIDLNNIKVTSEDGLSPQSADRCEATVPINFTGELPNQQLGGDVGDDVAGWFGDLGLDWETIGVTLKFIYDLIPLVGDGTELIVQLVNFLTGKGVDEVVATLSVIGFALDFPTDPATVAAGGVISGVKSIYKASQAVEGPLSTVISAIIKNPKLTATQKVELLKDTTGTYVDLAVEAGIQAPKAIKNADEVADALLKKGVDNASGAGDAVAKLKKGLDNLDNNPNPAFSNVNFDKARLLDAANTFKDTPGAAKADGGPLYDLARGNGVGSYTELVGAKGLQDKGHSITKFDDRSFTASDGKAFDIDALTTFGNKTYANQAKSLLTDPGSATTFANRMNDWINIDPGSRVGQFIFPEANPTLLPRDTYDAIKDVNPDIRIVDVNGNDIPRPPL